MLQTIRGRLMATMLCITLASLTAVGGAMLWLVTRETRASIDQSMAETTEGQADKLGLWAQEKRRNTSAVANAIGLKDPFPTLTTIAAAGGLDDAFLVYSNDVPVFRMPRPKGFVGTTRAWYKQAAAAGAPVITPAYADAATGELTVTFAEPIRDPKNPAAPKELAVLGSDVRLDGLSKMVAAIHPRDGSFAFLLEQDGKILAHPKRELALKPVDAALPGLDAARVQKQIGSAEGLAFTLDGKARLLYAHQVPGTPWTLGLVIDRDQAMAPVARLARLARIIVGISASCALLAGIVILWVVKVNLRRLGLLRDALDHIASGEGDLTRRLPEKGHDELAHIGRAFNQFVAKIAALMVRTRESSEFVRVASQEIAGGNLDLSGRTEQQASSIEQTASALEELTRNVQNNADSADQANVLANEARNVATRAGDAVSQVVSTMGSINDSSRKINDIIGVIDSIAFQTNILALNAAVEAARAGDQGRGFAVVASEVRTLAQRTATAAREIKSLISTSVEQVGQGGKLVDSAGQTMAEVVDVVRRVSETVADISGATAEQSRGLVEINGAIGLMDQATQQNAALVEEAAAAANSLQEQSALLANLVGEFKVDAAAHA